MHGLHTPAQSAVIWKSILAKFAVTAFCSGDQSYRVSIDARCARSLRVADLNNAIRLVDESWNVELLI